MRGCLCIELKLNRPLSEKGNNRTRNQKFLTTTIHIQCHQLCWLQYFVCAKIPFSEILLFFPNKNAATIFLVIILYLQQDSFLFLQAAVVTERGVQMSRNCFGKTCKISGTEWYQISLFGTLINFQKYLIGKMSD